jgi:tight adherence protein C
MIRALPLLYAALTAAAFSAVFFAAYALAVTPSQDGRRFGLRGLLRIRALETNSTWASIEPLVRWTATRIDPFIKGSLRAKLDHQITIAGDYLGLHAEEYLALCLLSSLSAAGFGAIVHFAFHKPAIFMVLTAAFGASVPYFHISGQAQHRLKRIQRALPHAIDLISLALTAGLDFPGALRQVIEKASDPDDPLVREVGYVLQELQLGKTRKEALMEFAARAPTQSVQEFVSAVVQAEERGNPLAEVLQIQAVSSRQRRSVRAEEQAAKAGLKIIGPCLCIFVCVVLLIGGPMFIGIQSHFKIGMP